ncbi:hypothetical protein M433DRAFT_134586 [Acidomyces richmondensis BFW]|nr:hypothetical protein M433DRAFT_134586 [Acidomyces richmondensis BFW]
MSPKPTIGYIGLGTAGFSMAADLPRAAARAAAKWPRTVDSHGWLEAFAEFEVVVIMLPQVKVVREVMLWKIGIAKALKEDQNMNRHDHNRHLLVLTTRHAHLGPRPGHPLPTLRLLDSAPTQTYMRATDVGKSTILFGGTDEDPVAFEIVRPILSCTARYFLPFGRRGDGHAMKTFNSYIMAVAVCALSDSLMAGAK